jgi:hypothetical protein
LDLLKKLIELDTNVIDVEDITGNSAYTYAKKMIREHKENENNEETNQINKDNEEINNIINYFGKYFYLVIDSIKNKKKLQNEIDELIIKKMILCPIHKMKSYSKLIVQKQKENSNILVQKKQK